VADHTPTPDIDHLETTAMIPRHSTDMAIAHDVIAERIQQAAHGRLIRSVRRSRRQAGPLRPVGRLLVRLGVALGGAPEPSAARNLSTVRPR
jgi:hypothetical protein